MPAALQLTQAWLNAIRTVEVGDQDSQPRTYGGAGDVAQGPRQVHGASRSMRLQEMHQLQRVVAAARWPVLGGLALRLEQDQRELITRGEANEAQRRRQADGISIFVALALPPIHGTR